jgi:hypothetical protein
MQWLMTYDATSGKGKPGFPPPATAVVRPAGRQLNR